VPFPFPNTPGRLRAVRIHDLNHVLTGYDTNTTGEFEISAWEIGSGCKDFYAAWQINLGGLAGGLLIAPKRTYRAFMRGRRSAPLYGRSYEELLATKVGETRAKHIAGEDETSARGAADVAWFVLAGVAGVVLGATFLAAMLPLVPIGLVTKMWLKAKQSKSAAPARA
jgi:hypothetical protein